MVGEGAYGQVFSATQQQTGELVAVKKILRTEIDRDVRDECLKLAKCSHSQIITYLDVSQPVLDLTSTHSWTTSLDSAPLSKSNRTCLCLKRHVQSSGVTGCMPIINLFGGGGGGDICMWFQSQCSSIVQKHNVADTNPEVSS
jgi:serine/threonine protein kinase